MVTVHAFLAWDDWHGGYAPFPAKGTEACIATAHGTIIVGTAEHVQESAIDAKGRYFPPDGVITPVAEAIAIAAERTENFVSPTALPH